MAPSAEPDKPDALLPEKEPVIYLGEAFRTYILVQWKGSLYFVDKHAAHERLLYEELKGADHSEPQQLLAPVSVTLSREEYAALSEQRDLLERLVLKRRSSGEHPAHPQCPHDAHRLRYPRRYSGDCRRFSGGQTGSGGGKARLFTIPPPAGRPSRGKCQPPAELLRLAERVLQNDDIRYCPHGRPVCFELTRQELEKQFGRIV